MSLVLSVLTPLCVLSLVLALPALHQVHYVCDVTGPWCLPPFVYRNLLSTRPPTGLERADSS